MVRFYTVLLAGIGLLGALRAQTSVIVVFSDEGDKFTLLIDGEAKNDVPAARVVARDIKNATPLVMINFENKQIPSIKQNGWMEPGLEYTLRITTNKKGAKVLRMQGQAPLGTAKETASGKPAPSNFRDDAPAATYEVIATDPVAGRPVQQTTTTTTTTGGNMNVMVDVNGMGVNMNINDGVGGTRTTTTTTTTTTTDLGPAPPAPMVGSEAQTGTGCGNPMSAADFGEAKASIESKGFDETKLTLAKQVAGSNCLSTNQVKAVMGIFGFEDSRLDFAKFAYDHVSDRNNYYQVNDAFSFSGSVDALNNYIKGR